MLATEYARYYGLNPQQESESDCVFKDRVSGALRDTGHIIEAHEVFNDARYEDDDGVVTGIVGAIAQIAQAKDYGSSGARQLADDFAAGVVAQGPKQDKGNLALLAALMGLV